MSRAVILPDLDEPASLTAEDRRRIADLIETLIGVLDAADAPHEDLEPEEDNDTSDDEPDLLGLPCDWSERVNQERNWQGA